MDVNQPDAAQSPTSRDADDPLAQARQVETTAYDALISDGGRPSHPLRLLEDIVYAPGQYRDILAYWQDRSEEWQVFSKQFSRWQTFRAHQRAYRVPDRFPSYVEELSSRLERHGFELPSSFNKPPSGFSRNVDRQDKLTTWVEYLNYEFARHDEYEKWLETCQPGYEEAVSHLVKSRVLRPFESVRTATNDICRLSSIEVTRRKDERRRAEEAYEDLKYQIRRSTQRGCDRYEMEEYERQLAEAERRLNANTKREYCISEFTRKTHAYRFALDRSERHGLLLRWVLDQVPLIEKEMEEHASRRSSVVEDCQQDNHASQPMFHRFQQLPPEIRFKIWTECLPIGPTVHFFEVLNHQRKRHLAHSWSSKEFRVYPTNTRESGYQVVYKLLATCREARLAVETYYGQQSLRSRCSSQGDEAEPGRRRLDFQTFDWIPAEDLVVLCFPPTQVPQLPAANAFTIAHGPGHSSRNIGVLVPKEVLMMPQFNLSDDVEGEDDAAQVSLMPVIVNRLHKPLPRQHPGINTHAGVKKLYFIVEGWTNHSPIEHILKGDSSKSPGSWPGNHVHWRFEAARQQESVAPWKRVTHCEELELMSDDGGKRQLWWLRSQKAALGVYNQEDVVEWTPGNRVNHFLRVLQTECDSLDWGPDFEGVEALGWMRLAEEKLPKQDSLDWMSQAWGDSDSENDEPIFHSAFGLCPRNTDKPWPGRCNRC